MNDFPSGSVTFMFTDLEGVTKIAHEDQSALQEILRNHGKIITESVESNAGVVFKVIGDSHCCAFANADDAVNAAITIQRRMLDEYSPDSEVAVRMGIHSGKAEWNGNDYMGYLTLARSNRVMSSASGKQIILTKDALDSFGGDVDISIPDRSLQGKSITFSDLGTRRLKDLIDPVRIFQVNAEGLQSTFPPIKTLDKIPNNLPVQLSSFIGRQSELKELLTRLDENRLITIVGPGGTGKTRLALQAAAETIDKFEYGVWIAELAALSDPTLLSVEIMRSLGIEEQQGVSPLDRVVEFLRHKKIMIILDTCEHLIEACSEIAQKLLQICPDLKLVATSREALHCGGEIIISLSSLDHPELDAELSPEELIKYEAVRLFVERALLVNPSFRINDANVKTVQRICCQLDGIPLALELAAARLRGLSPEHIADKLADRFRLLTGGNRSSLPRQQTLKAMIDWNYDLLNENEKILFKRLSVFSGGWTLESAETICSDDEIDEYEVMDILSLLVDKSIVISRETDLGLRFRMLENIRQYAMSISEDETEFRKRHAEYFEKFSNITKKKDQGHNEITWTHNMDADLENIRAALHWSIDNDLSIAIRTLKNMTEYWTSKGSYREGLEFCNLFLERSSELDKGQLAQVLHSKSTMEYGCGNISAAEKAGEESLRLYEEINDREGIAYAKSLLGVVYNMNFSKMDKATEYTKSSFEIFSEMGNRHQIANLLYNMSFRKNERGNSIKLKLEALEIYRELNDYSSMALTMTSLATVYANEGEIEESISMARQSLEISEKMGSKFLKSANHVILGVALFKKGEVDEAVEMLSKSIEISRSSGYSANLIPAHYRLGEIQLSKGDLESAVANFIGSLKTAKDLSIDYFICNAISGLGSAYYGLGDRERAALCFLVVDELINRHNMRLMLTLNFDKDKLHAKILEELGPEHLTSIAVDTAACDKSSLLELILKGI